ncbi:MAG TPA: hypothetical protein DD856_15565, partial [Sulfobacillus sp.]|nr:hypothetical protein [Sulfobacillus sp.]
QLMDVHSRSNFHGFMGNIMRFPETGGPWLNSAITVGVTKLSGRSALAPPKIIAPPLPPVH